MIIVHPFQKVIGRIMTEVLPPVVTFVMQLIFGFIHPRVIKVVQITCSKSDLFNLKLFAMNHKYRFRECNS